MRIPYTYLIGWSNSNMFYYGVRYARGCSPNDLWDTYFTSSKHVKAFRKKHGEPDIIQIRKTFDCKEKAILWEGKVLQKLDVASRKDFLNHRNVMATFTDKRRKFKDLPLKTQESRRLHSSINLKRRWDLGLVNTVKPEDTSNYKKAALKRWANDEFRNIQKSRKWMHLNNKSKMILPEMFDEYLSLGWNFGRGG